MRQQAYGRQSGFAAWVWFFSLVIGCCAPTLGLAQNRYSGQELSGRNFSGVKLDGADFSRSVLRGSVFRNASLRGANFQGADLRGADLSGADLTGADLRGAMMPPIAKSAIFSKANLEGVDLKGANFDKIDFSGANLRGTRGWGSIAGCKFHGAALEGSDFASAWKSAPTEAGMVADARYDDATRWPIWLDPVAGGAKHVETAMTLTPLPAEQPPPPPETSSHTQATLAKAALASQPATAPLVAAQAQPNGPVTALADVGAGKDMHGQKFVQQQHHHEFFDNANLQDADFTSANLSTSSFKNADLRRAIFKDAILTGVDMTGADLRDADLTKASFQDAKLGKANLEEQVLYLAGAEIFTEGVDKMSYDMKQVFVTVTDSNNGYLSFAQANLRNTQILGNLNGVDFRRADLRGADLTKTEHIADAVFLGAIYDSRTLWTVDPAKAGAVRGDDIAPPSKSFFVGKWAWKRETSASSKPDQAKYATLTVLKDGSYEWNPGEGDPIKGQWEIIDDPNALPAAKALLLHLGEQKLDWIAVPKGPNFLILTTSDHKQARDWFRS